MARIMVVVLIGAAVVALGWAMATGTLTSWWAWPLWLVGFVVIALLATSPRSTYPG